jgi:hypothetical protein
MAYLPQRAEQCGLAVVDVTSGADKDGIILQKFKGWGPDWAGVMRAEIEKALAQN